MRTGDRHGHSFWLPSGRPYSVDLVGPDLPDPEVDAAAAREAMVGREVERLRALPPDILATVLRRMEGP